MSLYITVQTLKIESGFHNGKELHLSQDQHFPLPLFVPLPLEVSKRFSLWQEAFCEAMINISPLTSLRFFMWKKNLMHSPHKAFLHWDPKGSASGWRL